MPLTLERPPVSLIEGAALFLDFDGTLVDLAEAPDAIHVGSQLPALLARLGARLNGRVAIVSGRAIADLERHLDLGQLCVSGSHGLELRMPGKPFVPVAALFGMDMVAKSVASFAENRPALLVEAKPFGVALHYRKAPSEEAEVLAFMSKLAETSGLGLLRGKMVAELRPMGTNKGHAILSFMSQPPFMGSRPLFIGDDVTDEDAFVVAAELGGGGILVGPERATAARWRLPDVEATAAWLEGASAP